MTEITYLRAKELQTSICFLQEKISDLNKSFTIFAGGREICDGELREICRDVYLKAYRLQLAGLQAEFNRL